jgi:hypothetical protein
MTDIVDNDFQLSAVTLSGKTIRNCPVCERSFKVERIGEHVRKNHHEFWLNLFTVESLNHSIDHQQLIKCTVQEKDHDQKVLVCLACNSLRTTDRDHFNKNGEVHATIHYEACAKMIAEKQGTLYLPKDKAEIETLRQQLEVFKRKAAMCDRDHSDMGALMCDKESAEYRADMVALEMVHREDGMRKHVKRQEAMRVYLKVINQQVREASALISGKNADKMAIKFANASLLVQQALVSTYEAV